MNSNDIQQNEKAVTQFQIKKIHTLLNQLETVNKRITINNITNGRTSSCREMTCAEARNMIGLLEDILKGNGSDKRTVIVSEIWDTAEGWGYIYGETDIDSQINGYLIDKFCLERGTVKKQIKVQTYAELKRTLGQFKAILKRYEELKQS